jgi:hypothetical protein
MSENTLTSISSIRGIPIKSGSTLEASIDLKIENGAIGVNTNGIVGNSADMSFVAGSGTYASGVGAAAFGGGTRAVAEGSHAEGGGSIASGGASHAEGGGTLSFGDCSHA